MSRWLPIVLALSGCAVTTVVVHPYDGADSGPQCGDSATILWGPAWRKDQKEPALREEIASKGITRFFAETPCYSDYQLLRQTALSDAEALALTPRRDRVVTIRVEELGPLVKLNLALVLLEGATEVKLRVRVLETATSKLKYDSAIHWTNGGAYVLKGVASLEQDLVEALKSGFPR